MSRDTLDAVRIEAGLGAVLRLQQEPFRWFTTHELIPTGVISDWVRSNFFLGLLSAGHLKRGGGKAGRHVKYRANEGLEASGGFVARFMFPQYGPRSSPQASGADASGQLDAVASAPPTVNDHAPVREPEEAGIYREPDTDIETSISRGLNRLVDAVLVVADKVDAVGARIGGVEQRLDGIFTQLIDEVASVKVETEATKAALVEAVSATGDTIGQSLRAMDTTVGAMGLKLAEQALAMHAVVSDLSAQNQAFARRLDTIGETERSRKAEYEKLHAAIGELAVVVTKSSQVELSKTITSNVKHLAELTGRNVESHEQLHNTQKQLLDMIRNFLRLLTPADEVKYGRVIPRDPEPLTEPGSTVSALVKAVQPIPATATVSLRNIRRWNKKKAEDAKDAADGKPT